MPEARTTSARARGVRAIIVYKTVKGASQLALCVVVAIVALAGGAPDLARVLEAIRHHLTLAWASHLAALGVRAATRSHLLILSVALGLDGVLSSFEGWALIHGHWWGPWLVVVATGSLLPYELVEIVLHPNATRAAIILLNVAIVWYLAKRAWREHRERASS